MVIRLGRALGLQAIPADAATPLYAAIVADTGGFRYSTTTVATFQLAAELVEAGARPWDVAYGLFEGWPAEKLQLLSGVLKTLTVHHGGRVAVMTITRALLDACGADDHMGEGLVSYTRHLAGVEVGVLLWEQPTTNGAQTKVSLRSRGQVDVSAAAVELGGGGHRGAAADATRP